MSKIVSFLKNVMHPIVDYYPELRDAANWEEHIAAGLRLELKHCPNCKSDFRGHRYASFASIRIGKGHLLAQQFLEAIQKHDWDAVRNYQSGEQTPDNAEACVIKCPTGGLTVLFVHTPFEPWDYASIDFCEVLTPEAGNILERTVTQGWVALESPRDSPRASS